MGNAGSTGVVPFPATASDWTRWGLGAVILGLVYYAFGIQVVEVGANYEFTCYSWLRNHWKVTYTHGPLIPLIAAGLVWMKRDEIRAVPLDSFLKGVWIIAAAMGFYWLGVRAMQPRITTFAFVVLLYGLVLTLGGRGLSRVLFFPIIYLLLMIPLNFLDELVGFRLQIVMAKASTGVLNLVGIEAIRVGTSIRSAVFDFDVANPCSGIRSLMALTTVTAAFAYVTQTVPWKRWLLFMTAIPLAVLGNLVRVVGIALVGQVYGAGPAMRVHDYSGLIVFGVALSAMVAIGFLLNLPYREVLESWLKPVTTPTVVPADLTPAVSKESHE